MNNSDAVPILYCDAELVWVDKPSGLLSVPGRGLHKQDCVVSRVSRLMGTVREVHRLDMDTSGVMVLARTDEVHREMCRQFRQRVPAKTYVARVQGRIASDRMCIEVPLRADITRRPRQIVDFEQGKEAVTHMEVIRREADSTLVRLKPLTGRTHQLRIHLNHIGHAILGDDLYGPDSTASRRRWGRLLLHANWLDVDHPATGTRFGVASLAPAEITWDDA